MPIIGLLAFSENSVWRFCRSHDLNPHQVTKRKFPGLQLAIVRDNKMIKVASYGLANIEDAAAVDVE